MARDGQGLDVSNAGAEAIAALDFLRDEWLAFGNRLAEFVAAADKEERCALLPVMAANLAAVDELGRRPRDRRRAISPAPGKLADGRQRRASGPGSPRPRPGSPATRDRSLKIHEDMAAEWPRDLLAGKLGQLHAFNRGDAEALLRIGERLSCRPIRENHYVCAMHALRPGGVQSHRRGRGPRAPGARRWTAAIPGRTTPSPIAWRRAAQHAGGRGLPAVDVRHLGGLQLLHVHPQLVAPGAVPDRSRPHRRGAGAVRQARVGRMEGILRGPDQRHLAAGAARAARRRCRRALGRRRAPTSSRACTSTSRPSSTCNISTAWPAPASRAPSPRCWRASRIAPSSAKPVEREAWADCAVPAAHGLAAYAKGDHAEAARLLGQAMPHLQPIGGSIAQRALFGAIHLDALMRSGWNDAALAILQADDRERPTVPWTKRALGDLYRRRRPHRAGAGRRVPGRAARAAVRARPAEADAT